MNGMAGRWVKKYTGSHGRNVNDNDIDAQHKAGISDLVAYCSDGEWLNGCCIAFNNRSSDVKGRKLAENIGNPNSNWLNCSSNDTVDNVDSR